LGHFEPSAIYRRGEDSRGQSKSFFRAGFNKVLAEGAVVQNPFWVASLTYFTRRLAAGLFHEGMLREHIFFGNNPEGELMITLPCVEGKIDESGPIKSVLIHPDKFYVVVERDIREYVNSLRDLSNVGLRENFKRAVDLRWKINEPDGIIGMSEEEFLRLSKK
jgi:hypothetical protein